MVHMGEWKMLMERNYFSDDMDADGQLESKLRKKNAMLWTEFFFITM